MSADLTPTVANNMSGMREARSVILLLYLPLLQSSNAWLVPSSVVNRPRSHRHHDHVPHHDTRGLCKRSENRGLSSGVCRHRLRTLHHVQHLLCAVASGEGGRGETASSSFEQWKEYFLQNNLGDPTTASTSFDSDEKNDDDNGRQRKFRIPLLRSGDKAQRSGATRTNDASHDTVYQSSITKSTAPDSRTSSEATEYSTEPTSSSTPLTSPTTSPEPPSNEGKNHLEESGKSQGADSRYRTAVEIMESRGETDTAAAHRAYLLLGAERTDSGARAKRVERSSTGSPDGTHPDESLLTKWTATALLSWIRCSTDGNGLVVADDGRPATADTPDRRQVWAENAPKVLQLVEEVGTDPALDPELQQIVAETIMYSLSSKGILEAFASGDTFAYTLAVKVLMERYPEHDNGVAFILNGAYYLAAPWPIRSPKKAFRNFEKALAVSKTSRRNNYYGALGRLACGDRNGARELFEIAADDDLCESGSLSEKDIAVMLRENARKGLAICNRSR